jgi:dephospho-CoA kinase
MYRKKLYYNVLIHIFLIGGAGTGKTFTLKLIIQWLLQIYNKDLSFNLTKKTLLMASTCKVSFNIDGQIINSTLNVPI